MDTGRLMRGGALAVLTGLAAIGLGMYLKIPARFAGSPAKVAEQQHACPMHPQVVQDHPGQCLECGMSLIPARQVTTSGEVCGANGEDHPGCCAAKQPATFQLPPGHPPIPRQTMTTNRSESASRTAN